MKYSIEASTNDLKSWNTPSITHFIKRLEPISKTSSNVLNMALVDGKAEDTLAQEKEMAEKKAIQAAKN